MELQPAAVQDDGAAGEAVSDLVLAGPGVVQTEAGEAGGLGRREVAMGRAHDIPLHGQRGVVERVRVEEVRLGVAVVAVASAAGLDDGSGEVGAVRVKADGGAAAVGERSGA